MKLPRVLVYIIVGIGVFALLRFGLPNLTAKAAGFLFGVQVIHEPPEIITRVDTVPVLDTLEIARWRETARAYGDSINLLRRMIHQRRLVRVDTIQRIDTVPATGREPVCIDTVLTFAPLAAIEGLDVPLGWGDSTIVRGFNARSTSEGVFLDKWRAVYFTPGPLRSLVVDTAGPSIAFWPTPDPPCGLGCSLKKYAIGALGGGAVCLAVKR